METKLTEEQQKDSAQRIATFKAGYQKLVAELQVDFLWFPQFIPNQQGTFSIGIGVQMMDKKYMPVESPLTKDEIIKKD